MTPHRETFLHRCEKHKVAVSAKYVYNFCTKRIAVSHIVESSAEIHLLCCSKDDSDIKKNGMDAELVQATLLITLGMLSINFEIDQLLVGGKQSSIDVC